MKRGHLASLEATRHQQAKSGELRASTTLVQLLDERGARGAARDLLAPSLFKKKPADSAGKVHGRVGEISWRWWKPF